MHSYGALVGSESVPEDLTSKNCNLRDLSGGVANLVFNAAFIMAMEQYVATAVGDSPHHDHWDSRFKIRDPLAVLYNDLPSDEATDWAAKVIPRAAQLRIPR